MSASKPQNPWTTKVSSGLSFSEILRSKEVKAAPATQKASEDAANVVKAVAPVASTTTTSTKGNDVPILPVTVSDAKVVGAGKVDVQKKYSSATSCSAAVTDVGEQKGGHHVVAQEKPLPTPQVTPQGGNAHMEHANVRPASNLHATSVSHRIEHIDTDLFVENSHSSIPLSPRAPTTYHQQVELISFGFGIELPGNIQTYTFVVCEGAEHVASGKSVEVNASPVPVTQAGGASNKRGTYGQARNGGGETEHVQSSTKVGDIRPSVASGAVIGAGVHKPQVGNTHEITNRALHELVSHVAPPSSINDTRTEHVNSQFLPGNSGVSSAPMHNNGAVAPPVNNNNNNASGHSIPGHNTQHAPSSNASSNSNTPSAHTTSNLPYPGNNGGMFPPTSPGVHPTRVRGPHNATHQAVRGGHAPPHTYMPRYSPQHGAFPVHANQWPGYGYTPMSTPPGQAPPSTTSPTTVPPGRGPAQPVGGRNMFTRGAPIPPYYPTYDYGMSYGGHPNAHHMSNNGGPAVSQSNGYGMIPGPYPNPFYGHPSVSSNSTSNTRYNAGGNTRYNTGAQNIHEHASNQY